MKKFNASKHDFQIIIVDDSAGLVSVYERAFRAAGLKVAAKFGNGKDVLDYFDIATNGSTEAIVLLDHKMPEINGLEVAKRIKERHPNQKIILVAAEGAVKFKIDVKFFDGMIFKPFTISELLDEIERIISPIQIKGSRIFSEPVEIENLLHDILTDSKEKLCSVRNPASIIRGPHLHEHISTYVSAISKGIEVYLVTEIMPENLAFCKELMLNRGVQVRHLNGVSLSFAVWDEKHVAESIELPSVVSPYGYIFYSNLESDVRRNQYLFEYLWKRAMPADARIRELEASPDLTKATVVSGYDDLLKVRMKMVREARTSIDICANSQILSKVVIPSFVQDHRDAINRGIRNRYLFDITSWEDVDCAKILMNIGIDVRHLKNSVALFGVSEKACIWMATVKDVGKNEETRGMYSTQPDCVEQYRSIFEVLWNSALPAVERIKEIEEKEESETESGSSSNLDLFSL